MRVHPTDAVVIRALSTYAVRPGVTLQEQRACIDHLTDVGHDAAADTLAAVLGPFAAVRLLGAGMTGALIAALPWRLA